MSRKTIIILIIAIITLIIAYWLVSPLFITRTSQESFFDILPQSNESDAAVTELAKGTFVGLAAHSGSGTATLVDVAGKKFIRFEEDFRVTNGPDLFVYLGSNGAYDKHAQLARLKGNQGGQNYEIPSSLDLSKYNEVWVWCRAFSVPFAKAELT